jgi:hypothetical protein
MYFTENEYSVIYDAVRHYQINKTVTSSQEYWECDSILKKLFEKKKFNGVEPGYRTDT